MRTRFDLVIFDCDGVLVDSEPIANRVLAEQLAAAGLPMAYEEVMRRFVGRTREGCLALARDLLGRDLPEDFGAKWDAALFEALDNEVKAIEGVVEAIRQIGLPTALPPTACRTACDSPCARPACYRSSREGCSPLPMSPGQNRRRTCSCMRQNRWEPRLRAAR